MKSKMKLAALAVALVVVAACSSTVVQQTQAVDYSREAPIKLNAVKIEVVSEYQPRGAAPSVDHMMDKNPQAAVVDWAKGRLRAAGQSGYVQVKIKDASVISRVLSTQEGVSGYFTREGAEELVARLEVDINGDQRDQMFNGYTTIEATQVLTVPEGASAAERKAVETDLINKLMAQFNSRAAEGIQKHLAPMLKQ